MSHRGQRGYTLIEVIVAFAVLGIALMLLLGTLSNGTRQVRWAADSGRAALHAQSLLDGIGIDIPVVPGSTTGGFEDGRYRWTLEIAPYVDPQMPPALVVPSGQQLFEIALAVDWGERGPRERLQVHTLRLREPDAPGVSMP
ncbi:type II secretion system protein XpsI [Luteimonas terrae]|uniref:General secretion pathway protein I n=1 Tax=Luteimonas terrae TaxID=1530191 RepID=A0ABU1XVZ9_9GAMM|nr:type II secretion system protein [Luteimonas terrae]MDR7192306.1 general secretion pathway protein I [Luteimonas terrae]